MPEPTPPASLRPGQLGPLRLRNRFIKAATYEGMSPGGVAGPALVEHHRRLAQGGVAMTTVAYGAVHPDGRTFDDQLCLRPEAVSTLRPLTDAVHAAGALASIQLAHCGFFSKLRPADGGLPRGPSRTFNKYGAASGLPLARAMRTEEIEAIPGQFVAAAEVAREAGFDAVELHLGHGYLLSQFLSPATNRRRDRYGGSLERRMRLPLAVVDAVRAAVASSMAVTAKLNVLDGFRGGAGVDEACTVAERLDAAGIDGVVTSGGSTSRNPLFLLRGQRPLAAMIAVERSPAQRLALRVLGPAVLRAYPFEETFFRAPGRTLNAR
ncbi:MAG: NADH:flavin oxidoreductase [Nannocystaceae bacterium]